MKIYEVLQKRSTVFSCEVFPHKLGTELAHAASLVEKIAEISPDFISVTCGAAGNTAANTEEVAACIEAAGIPALAHVTCVSSVSADLDGILKGLSARGVSNILALRGDIPAGMEPSDFGHASDLVRRVKAAGDFCVGGACYPDGHVESKNQNEDIDHLRLKVQAGCDFLTTQMFFDNDLFYRFLNRLHRKGIQVPVLAGIMPVTHPKQIKQIISISGTPIPSRMRTIIDRFGDDTDAMKQAGIIYACEQIVDLIACGVKGVHVYTMNHPDVAKTIKNNLRYLLG